ncbi:hypothetical protein HZB02_02430 [Candidatus Woesearchaeota archaeon]|nr:hypothetical protein [Candidatus Woesearchaeota archaeon]
MNPEDRKQKLLQDLDETLGSPAEDHGGYQIPPPHRRISSFKRTLIHGACVGLASGILVVASNYLETHDSFFPPTPTPAVAATLTPTSTPTSYPTLTPTSTPTMTSTPTQYPTSTSTPTPTGTSTPIRTPYPAQTPDLSSITRLTARKEVANALFHSSYQDLLFEPQKLTFLRFDASLAALRMRGYDRHARPSEEFGFIIAGMEGRLSAADTKIAGGMVFDGREWLSMAYEVTQSGGKQWLTVYVDPTNLQYRILEYQWNGPPQYSASKRYEITGLPLKRMVDLDKFPVVLVND